MQNLALVLVFALPGATAWAADGSHKTPAAPAAQAPTPFEERRAKLAEMWQRGLIPSDSQSFTPQDEELLAKIHQAETAGAVRLLKARGAYGGFVVELKTSEGRRQRLTKAGYERWRVLRTQDALAFFQSRDIGVRDALRLKDLDGNPLFDKDAMLTPQGQTVYNLAIANLEAHWVTFTGEVLGNRPPPKKKSP